MTGAARTPAANGAGPIVVTGASGFIGRRLVAVLRSAGWAPLLVDRIEVTDPDALQSWARLRPRVVFHLAVARGPARAHAVNVAGTDNVLAAATGARVVHLGGALEADSGSAYGASKAEATRRALDAGAVVVRPTFVYGPGQDPTKLIPTVLRAAREGRPIPMLRAAPVDWVYVDDVVAACMSGATSAVPDGTLLDVASGALSTPSQVVDAAEIATNCRIVRVASDESPRPWDRPRHAISPSPLLAQLGVHMRALPEGLRTTWEITT